MSEEIIYFELDNWFSGRDYPNAEPFNTWMGEDDCLYFACDRWVKENKLCVTVGDVDMSLDFCIAAPKSWVEANCPKLLTDEECGSTSIISHFNHETQKWEDKEHYESNKYSKFLRPDQTSRFGVPFPEYSEENIGVTWYSHTYDEDTDEWFYEKVNYTERTKWDDELEEEIYGKEDNNNAL